MTIDAHKNFAISTVATAPSPATSGTSLVVAAGEGARFPTVPFNAVIWPTGFNPTATNAEIVRVTARSTDTLTITRTQESTSARTVIVGDQIGALLTKKNLTDIQALAPARDVQTFDAGGTWTKPDGVTLVEIICIGPGGGGGGGASAASTTLSGGSGGGGGCLSKATVRASDLSPTETVTVGTAGTGGTAGNPGTDGTSSTFGSKLKAGGGGGGPAGSTASQMPGGGGGGGGSAVGVTQNGVGAGFVTSGVQGRGTTSLGAAGGPSDCGGACGAGGLIGSGGTALGGGDSLYGGPGGGAGGGVSSAGTNRAGGAGGGQMAAATAGGGGGGASGAHDGSNGTNTGLYCGDAGGGGGGNSAGTGGRGGDGARAAGGGGGGAGTTGGRGGDGGPGRVIVMSW